MAFSTKHAKRHVMSADVRDWSSAGAPEETRTLVATLSPTADVPKLESNFRNLGVDIVSTGANVMVVSISRKNTAEVSHILGVARLEMPTHYEPSSPFEDDESTDCLPDPD